MGLKFVFPADVREIYQRLTDPDFLVERCAELGDSDAECEVEETDSTALVKMSYVRETDLPSFLTSLFSAKPTLRIEEQWRAVEDRYEGSSTLLVEGQPGSVHAEFTLSPTKKGCEFKVSHKAKIKIPLIGRKVEKFIVKTIGEDVQREMDYLTTELAS